MAINFELISNKCRINVGSMSNQSRVNRANVESVSGHFRFNIESMSMQCPRILNRCLQADRAGKACHHLQMAQWISLGMEGQGGQKGQPGQLRGQVGATNFQFTLRWLGGLSSVAMATPARRPCSRTFHRSWLCTRSSAQSRIRRCLANAQRLAMIPSSSSCKDAPMSPGPVSLAARTMNGYIWNLLRLCGCHPLGAQGHIRGRHLCVRGYWSAYRGRGTS